MKTQDTAEAVSRGGRSGTIHTPDGLLNFDLGDSETADPTSRGPTPEQLFAAAYSACYHSALMSAARRLEIPLRGSTVRVFVSLVEDDQGGSRLAVALHGQLPGIDPAPAQRIMEIAHLICPYSRALRGDVAVRLVVDQPRRIEHEEPSLQTH